MHHRVGLAEPTLPITTILFVDIAGRFICDNANVADMRDQKSQYLRGITALLENHGLSRFHPCARFSQSTQGARLASLRYAEQEAENHLAG